MLSETRSAAAGKAPNPLMPTHGLEIRRGVSLTTRGGSAQATADHYLLPRTEAEAELAMAAARRCLPQGARGALTLAGAERSFEAHFLPRAEGTPRVVVSSRRLRGEVRVLGDVTTPGGESALAVRALAGTSFGELLRAVKHAGFEAMPFSCPTADAISLGGALAVNTHSRTSLTYGGLFAQHVRRFTLLAPDGRRYDCHASAETALERRLFRYVPGALGALGLVTELELELARIAPSVRVVTEVLERDADPATSVTAYLSRVAADAHARVFSEGFNLVFFGPPGRGSGVVVGRRRLVGGEPSPPTLPLFRERSSLNVFVQTFAHRFPGVARALAAGLLAPGRTFSAPYYRWAFFQSSYDEGWERLSRRGSPETRLFATELGLVHQGWVMTSAALPPFVALASDLFAEREFESVAEALEFFDVLPLPAPVSPLDPSLAVASGLNPATATTHVLTLSIAVHDARARELAAAYCHTLTARAVTQGLAVVVQLNKQHHARPSLLRAMHHTALAELSALKATVDSEGLLGSGSLERLGV